MQETPAPPEAILIRQARRSSRLKQPEVAMAAGISPSRVAQIEAGRMSRKGPPVRAPADTLARIAQAVGVTAGELRDLPAEGKDKERLEDAAALLDRMGRGAPPPPLHDIPSPDGQPQPESRADLKRQALDALDEAISAHYQTIEAEQAKIGRLVAMRNQIEALPAGAEERERGPRAL